MNTVITSREAIIAACRKIAEEQGLGAINMRVVAENCKVAVGSVYNYFPSKAELVAATIQEVWQDIFHNGGSPIDTNSFVDYLNWIFTSVCDGTANYPNFFLAHSMTVADSDKGKARQVMQAYFNHMQAGLLEVLHADSRVREDAFDCDFTQSAFVEFVFSSLLSLLMRQEKSCDLLCEIVRRAIY